MTIDKDCGLCLRDADSMHDYHCFEYCTVLGAASGMLVCDILLA